MSVYYRDLYMSSDYFLFRSLLETLVAGGLFLREPAFRLFLFGEVSLLVLPVDDECLVLFANGSFLSLESFLVSSC